MGQADMPARVILWDLMDTLVRDPFFTHVPAFFGCSFEALLPQLLPGTWVDFELGKLQEEDLYARFFRDRRAFDGPGLKRCMHAAYAWVDGAEGLLQELAARDVSMHALSNYPAWYQLVEERLGLSRYLKLSFVSCHTGLRKPAPEAFLNACATLAREPGQCLLVDDREQNCRAARALGLEALHFDGRVDALRRAFAERGLL